MCAGRLVVFGGRTQEGRRLGDVWALNTGSELFFIFFGHFVLGTLVSSLLALLRCVQRLQAVTTPGFVIWHHGSACVSPRMCS